MGWGDELSLFPSLAESAATILSLRGTVRRWMALCLRLARITHSLLFWASFDLSRISLSCSLDCSWEMFDSASVNLQHKNAPCRNISLSLLTFTLLSGHSPSAWLLSLLQDAEFLGPSAHLRRE